MGADNLAFFDHTWKPTIAAINGYAMAGGWAIAQMCDLRVAAEDAMMGITETRWSLLPPFATALPKLIPMAAALELVMTAKPITAQRAYEMGLLNAVVPREQLLDTAYEFARRITANAPLAVQATKQSAIQGLYSDELQITRVREAAKSLRDIIGTVRSDDPGTTRFALTVATDVLDSLAKDLRTAFEHEARISSRIFRTEDAKEGPRAFAEKRPPNWQAR